jgi:lysyl endopeptidase
MHKIARNILIALMLLPSFGMAQEDRMGTPYSWNSQEVLTGALIFEEMPEVNLIQLINEDNNAAVFKNHAFRFAKRQSTSFNLNNSGRWFELQNSANVWMLGIECQEAQGIGITFGEFFIPRKGKLFIYNQDRSELIGALTSEDNTESGAYTIPALQGERIIIEYYEPPSVSGQGELSIRSVSHVYHNIFTNDWDAEERNSCYVHSTCSDSRTFQEASKAVVQIAVDGGTRWVNGVFVNQTGRWKSPLIVTTTEALYDSPENWLFKFNHLENSCKNEISGLDNKHAITSSGAELLAIDEENGLILLRLFDNPSQSGRVFYSGWDRSEESSLSSVACINHPEGQTSKIALNNNTSWATTWNQNPVWQIQAWEEGTVGNGGVGSPLFNSKGQLVGLYTGGFDTCTNDGLEYFTKFALSWDVFKPFLDPDQSDAGSIAGEKPTIFPADNEIEINKVALFPNPATDYVRISNTNEETVSLVVFYDAQGRIVLRTLPIEQTVNLNSLVPGVYTVETRLQSQSVYQKLVVR